MALSTPYYWHCYWPYSITITDAGHTLLMALIWLYYWHCYGSITGTVNGTPPPPLLPLLTLYYWHFESGTNPVPPWHCVFGGTRGESNVVLLFFCSYSYSYYLICLRSSWATCVLVHPGIYYRDFGLRISCFSCSSCLDWQHFRLSYCHTT